MTMRRLATARRYSGRMVSTAAATVEPVIEPMPPSTTIATTSKLRTKVKLCGARLPSNAPLNAPATPAKKALITNARTLYPVVSIPIASAATSSSRTERKARPWVESRSRLATMMVPMAAAQAQRGLSHQVSGNRGGARAGEHREHEEDPVGVLLRAAHDQHRAHVSAHGHEPGVPDGELAGEPVHQVQRHG